MTNKERFLQAYLEALTKNHSKHPEEYFYPADKIPSVAEKMVLCYSKGEANPSPSMRQAAKACGIKPTLKAVREFLNQ